MDINYYKQYEPIGGKWYLVKELGRGSFGTVYEAERKDDPGMKAAIKIISIPASTSEFHSFKNENYDMDDQSITSFYRGLVDECKSEFQLMSKLKGNSHIVSYEDHDIFEKKSGEFGWDIFIRMELLTSINDYFKNQAVVQEQVAKLGKDICSALEICRKNNIIHRDIKPSNIFISKNGDFKLGDFGVARTLEQSSASMSKKGTYTYMAPEVYKGEKYSGNVDIYSLGIVMYKILNKNFEPFRTDRTFNAAEIALTKRMKGEPIPPLHDIDPELSRIILKACEYDPKKRYDDPSEMKHDLEKFLNTHSDSTNNDSNNSNTETLTGEETVIDETVAIFDRNENKEEKNDIQPNEPNDKSNEKKQTNKKSFNVKEVLKKKVVIIPVAAVLLIAVLGFIGLKLFSSGNIEGGTVVNLFPDEQIEAAQVEELMNVIEQRTKNLDGKIKLSADENKIEMTFDDAVLTDDPTIRKQRFNWLTTKGDISIKDNVSFNDMEIAKGDYEVTGIEQISKSDLLKYKDYLSEEFMDTMTSIEGDMINLVTIKLGAGAKVTYGSILESVKNRSYISDTRNALDMCTDYLEYDYSTNMGALIPVENSDDTLYLLSRAAYNQETVELIENVLNEDSELQTGVGYRIVSEPMFETDTAVFGKNQADKINGDYIRLTITPDNISADEYTTEDIQKYEQLVKVRLDILGCPYAVGFTDIDNKTMVIDLPPSHLIADSVNMLTNKKNMIMNTQYKTLDAQVENVTVNGTESITVTMSENKAAIYDEYNKSSFDSIDLSIDPTETAPEIQDSSDANGVLYLIVNGVTIAKGDLSAMADDGSITMNTFECFENGQVTKDTEYMLNLINHINSETSDDANSFLSTSFEMEFYKNGELSEEDDPDWLYDSETEYDKEIMGKIEKLGHTVKLGEGRSTLWVTLDFPLDNSLAENFTNAVKEIYTTCDFDNGAYSWVYFVIKGEDANHPDDRCRIVAHKDGLSSLSVVLSATVTGPTYEDYYNSFNSIWVNDEFFSSREW